MFECNCIIYPKSMSYLVLLEAIQVLRNTMEVGVHYVRDEGVKCPEEIITQHLNGPFTYYYYPMSGYLHHRSQQA